MPGTVRKWPGVLLLGLSIASPTSGADEPREAATQFRLGIAESDDFDIVMQGRLYEFLVPHVGGSMRNALQFHQALWGWQPHEKPTIFLNDWSDNGQGWTNTVPFDRITIGVSPFFYTFETISAIDRMFWLANHEVAHVATMDGAAGRDLTWRKLFVGKVVPDDDDPLSIFYNYLTNPRWNAPRWYQEGIATFMETWMAGGIGRAQGAYDEMVFRSMVRDDAYFYDVIGLESEGVATDFQTMVNAYLYGTRFMSYLAYVHGPQSVIDWVGRRPGSKAYYASQFEQVYDVPLKDEWRRWIAFEKEWQQANLAAIREHPTTAMRDLSSTPLGSVSRSFIDHDAGKLYLAVRYPGQVAHVAAIDLATGEIEKIHEVKGPVNYYVTSIAFDQEHKVLYLTSDNSEWRDLWRLDLATGEQKRVSNNLRMGDLVFDRSNGTLWGVQHRNGASVLMRIPPPYDTWYRIYTFPYGTDLYDIDVSPDGSMLTGGLAEIDGSQSLVMFEVADLLAGKVTPEKLFDFDESLAANFTFSGDGRNLYGSSYYSGASNVYRFDLEKREMFVLSNVETGLFRPQELSDDELLAFRYSGDGFIPVAIPKRDIEKVSAVRFLGTELAKKQPLLKEWAVGSPRDVGFVAPKVEQYSSIRHLQMSSVYPVVEGYKDSIGAGLRLNLSDPIGQDRLAIAASYSPDEELESDEKLHLDLELNHWRWVFRGTWNRADFYDLFGPTKKSRRGWSLGYQFEDVLVWDDPRFLRIATGAEHWGDLETLPNFQNVDATASELDSVWGRLQFDHLRTSLGAVENAEKGTAWKLEGTLDYVDSDVIPRVLGTFDRGFQVPIGHSSIWIRSAAGYAFGDIDDDFSRFFFGGFGNNYIDHETEKRYREYYSFPGLELNEVGGRSFAKAMLEWTLPPIRFRRLGVPAFYLNFARPALFAGVIRTDPDDEAFTRTLETVGAQLDFKLVIFSNLPSILSIGYGVGFEDGRSSDEVMISLKIL